MPIKPPGPVLGAGAIRTIERAITKVFRTAKERVLGVQSVSKRIAIGLPHEFSLPGLFELAAREEGVKPDAKTLAQVLRIAGGYIDATEAKTKARVIKEVTAFLQEAHATGVQTDLKTVLGGKLTEVLGETVTSMRRIIDTEAQNVKNTGILDGICRINAASGVNDPVVYFVSVNDDSRCPECTKLHTIDGTTPRLWLLSELGHGYHKRGESNPKLGGLHPNCRCTMATVMEGYGFIKGRIAYIGRGHRALEEQRALAKSESLDKMAPVKTTHISLGEAHAKYKLFRIVHDAHIPGMDGDRYVATPDIPRIGGVKGEDRTTPRVSVAPSIHHAAAGVTGWTHPQDWDQGDWGFLEGRRVYGLRQLPPGHIPNKHVQTKVPDAKETGEEWLTQPAEMEYVGHLVLSSPEDFMRGADPVHLERRDPTQFNPPKRWQSVYGTTGTGE